MTQLGIVVWPKFTENIWMTTHPSPGINPLPFSFGKIWQGWGRHVKPLLPPDGIKSFCGSGFALTLASDDKAGEEEEVLPRVWAAFQQGLMGAAALYFWFLKLKFSFTPIWLCLPPMQWSVELEFQQPIITNFYQLHYSWDPNSLTLSNIGGVKVFPTSLIDQQH
jgi:hypothetical protein